MSSITCTPSNSNFISHTSKNPYSEDYTPKEEAAAETAANKAPNSILGFSNDLISKLQKSRNSFQTYITQQKELVNGAYNRQSHLASLEQEEINAQIQQLKIVLIRQGVVVHDEESKEDQGQMEEDGEMKTLKNEKNKMEQRQHSLEKQLANLHVENASLKKDMREVKRIEQTQALKAKEVETKRLEIERSKQVTVEDLTYAVLKYKKLGLDFSKGGDNNSIQCNFTQMDPNFPSKLFAFLLKVTDGGDRYEVEGCCPDLKAGVIYSLVEQFNETNDFPVFIRSMRRAFKETLEES